MAYVKANFPTKNLIEEEVQRSLRKLDEPKFA
jgi:hypothetical protein